MTWRFRKSFSPLPGVRITLTPRGVSTSVGVGPVRLTSGSRGLALTTRVPGTGVSFQQPLFRGEREEQWPPSPAPSALIDPRSMEEIRSAGSSALESPGLAEFARLLSEARREQEAIGRDLHEVRGRERQAVARFQSWRDGWLFRRLRPQRFEAIEAEAVTLTAHREELEEQEQLAKLSTELSLTPAVTRAFSALCDDFSVLAGANRIWDTVSHRSANRVVERTTASRIVERKRVAFQLASSPIIESEWRVPHLANANGGDLYLYPAFALYFVSAKRFALIEHKDITLAFRPSRFIEEEEVPSDAAVVDQTWAKANKDGSPDRRFANNYAIPVAAYGMLNLTSATGLNEEYMVSNLQAAERFARTWAQFIAATEAA